MVGYCPRNEQVLLRNAHAAALVARRQLSLPTCGFDHARAALGARAEVPLLLLRCRSPSTAHISNSPATPTLHLRSHRGRWLDELPNAHKLCTAICLRQDLRCKEPAVAKALGNLTQMRMHSCVEEPGANEAGHEGVCAFRFLMDNYDRSWHGVYFTHGDVPGPKHGGQFWRMRKFFQDNEWPPWPDRREDITPRHCGCNVPSTGALFGPKDFWFKTVTWWMGEMTSLRDPAAANTSATWISNIGRRASEGAYFLHNGTLFSPIGFMFAVDRRSVHLRSLRFLEANYRLCKYGVRVLPEGWTSYPPQNLGNVPALPGQNVNGFGAKPFIFNPLIWGHVNERLPFHLFGHEFVERPMPECIFRGIHANMNCTQPAPLPGTWRLGPSGKNGTVRAGSLPRASKAVTRNTLAKHAATLVEQGMPRDRRWCKPLDDCGSTTG